MCTLQEQRLRMLRTLQPLTLLLPHLVFKTGLLKPFGELRVLWGMNPPFSLHGRAMYLSLRPTPMFCFVWPHCALGT